MLGLNVFGVQIKNGRKKATAGALAVVFSISSIFWSPFLIALLDNEVIVFSDCCPAKFKRARPTADLSLAGFRLI